MINHAPPPFAVQPRPPYPPPEDRRSSLARVIVSSVVFVGCAATALFTGVLLFRSEASVTNTVVVVPAGPASFSPEEVAAARQTACDAWSAAALTIKAGGDAAADAPKSWDDPLTKRAEAAETRTTLVETAYLRGQVGPATPPEVAGPMHDYLVATFDQQDASVRHKGADADAAIDRINVATHQIVAACGLK